ncbi:hypothetical protein HPP92_011533 [Vanilla planifolia]|uniref:Uncharacterized protein n=1 Tax=Vanilla planifolia TaxID=51239 RepID=A0A835UYT7_VANPL|nr:hypothetical protein HPP92_011827 [Vanilla planifolia]KAG0483449.1 hypothetical protein HPP92_011533 [Vanilla planifolia]
MGDSNAYLQLVALAPIAEASGDSEFSTIGAEGIEAHGGGEVGSCSTSAGCCYDSCGGCGVVQKQRVMAWSAWLLQWAVAQAEGEGGEPAEKEVTEHQRLLLGDETEENRLFWERCLATEYP